MAQDQIDFSELNLSIKGKARLGEGKRESYMGAGGKGEVLGSKGLMDNACRMSFRLQSKLVVSANILVILGNQ